jgi:hypothetical protein
LARRSSGGGATARAYVESVDMPDGQATKPAVARVKIKF